MWFSFLSSKIYSNGMLITVFKTAEKNVMYRNVTQFKSALSVSRKFQYFLKVLPNSLMLLPRYLHFLLKQCQLCSSAIYPSNWYPCIVKTTSNVKYCLSNDVLTALTDVWTAFVDVWMSVPVVTLLKVIKVFGPQFMSPVSPVFHTKVRVKKFTKDALWPLV